MRPTGKLIVRSKLNEVKGERPAMRYFGAIATPSASDECVPVLVSKMDGKGSIQKRIFMRRNIATRYPNVALRNMLQRHVLGAASYERGDEVATFDLPDTSKVFLQESEAMSLLRWVLDIFAPDVPYNLEEREEIILSFLDWRRGEVVSLSTPVFKCNSPGGYLNFKQFSDWFLSQVNRIGRLSHRG